MVATIENMVGLIIVALLWGITNPLMKYGIQGIKTVKSSTRTKQFFTDIFFLVTNLKYMGPFLINQSGSLLYIFILQKTDLSLTVVVNSLTFVITALTSIFLKEEKIHRKHYIGVILILTGTILSCFDKVSIIKENL